MPCSFCDAAEFGLRPLSGADVVLQDSLHGYTGCRIDGNHIFAEVAGGKLVSRQKNGSPVGVRNVSGVIDQMLGAVGYSNGEEVRMSI